MPLVLTSSAFDAGTSMPARFTCDGDDLSPPLTWSGAPPGTKSFALIVDDPDAPDPRAPQRTWVHWVLYNLPPECERLEEGARSTTLPEGTGEGTNDWSRTGYGGPCPPIGEHRYFHKLYALDAILPDLGNPTKAELLDALEGHVLDRAEIIGLFDRGG